MRMIVLYVMLLMTPMTAFAQTAAFEAGSEVTPAGEGAVPLNPATPVVHFDGYRVFAITAGSIGGLVVANAVAGSVIAPLYFGTGPAFAMGPELAAALTNYIILRTGLRIGGAVLGGYVGDWWYTTQYY